MSATKRFLEDVSVFIGLDGEINQDVIERAQEMLEWGVKEILYVECTGCGKLIPPERLAVMPGATECVKCVEVPDIVGFMVPQASKGCASELMIVPSGNKEALRQAINANRRRR